MSFNWPNNARVAMSFVINIEEGSEMSLARGDKGPEPVDEFEATPTPEPVVIDPAEQSPEPMPEPVAEPEQLDISDTAIKTALSDLEKLKILL